MKAFIISHFLGTVVTLIAIAMIYNHTPGKPFFQSWSSKEDSCSNFCMDESQEYSKVLSMAPGSCVCDNPKGRELVENYNACMGEQ